MCGRGKMVSPVCMHNKKESFSKCTFLMTISRRSGSANLHSASKGTPISPHSIVVLDPLARSDEINKFVSGMSIPVYRYVCATKRPGASSQDLVIIPAFARSVEHEDLVKLFQTTEAKLKTFGLGVMTYQNYCQQFRSNSPNDELVISNQFQELPEEDAPGYNNQDVDNVAIEDNSNDGFTEVSRRSEQQKLRFRRDEQKIQIPCKWGVYCFKSRRVQVWSHKGP